MDYGAASGTGVLAVTGGGLAIVESSWLLAAAVAGIALGAVIVRMTFRRGKLPDDDR